MTTGLTALSIITPAFPSGATTLSVDSSVLGFVIAADTSTIAIDVIIAGATTTLTTFTDSGAVRQFSGTVPITYGTDSQLVEVIGRNYSSTVTPTVPMTTPTIQFSLVFVQSYLSFTIPPPSGVTIYKNQSTCRVEWAMPTYSGFTGVRVQWSTDASGVNTPYVQYGDLQNEVNRTADVVVVAPTTSTASVTVPGVLGNPPTNVVTTTSSFTTVTVDYGSVDIPASLVNADIFYAVISAVMQDPTTNAVYESQQSGPFTCGFVNLKKVNPTDFLALQRQNDIASRLISEMTRRRPDLDLTSHAEPRDVLVNPVSIELSNISVREWFSRCAVSISAIAQIDDANGDGVSDPVASSPTKQQIARAYGLSQTDVQTFIDSRFDVLGEAAGIERGGATFAVVDLTFYTYSYPTTLITVAQNTICSTIPGGTDTTSVNFVTTASGTIDPTNAAAYYDTANGWYSITVPAQAQVAGASGAVGAETITQVGSGGTSGLSVTNLTGSRNGTDEESNADYAARIQNRNIVGKDTGSRMGYWGTAMETSGVTDAYVVAAGDLDMLRDWSAVMQKHTFGCVDIYARGTTQSQQTEYVPYSLPTVTLAATVYSATKLIFKLSGFSIGSPIYALVSLVATASGNSIYLGVNNAQFDNINGYLALDPAESPFVVNSDGTTTVWQLNGANTTNLAFIQAISPASTAFSVTAQYQDGISHVPALQPVLAVDSISGPITGNISSADISLVYTNDFLLTGGSNNAGDTVVVSYSSTNVVTNTLTLAAATTFIDTDIQLSTDYTATGNVLVGNALSLGNIISVRSADLSTVYTFNLDYTIVAAGKYHAYSLKVMNDAVTGLPRIPLGTTQVVVAYYQYVLRERVTFQTDTLVLIGSTPTPLLNGGFIHNTWLPANHGDTALLLDGYNGPGIPYTGLLGAGVSPASRYIKVTYNNGVSNVILIEGRDFSLSVDDSGNASLTRVTGGAIPDGGTVTASYYTNEVLTIATEYPTFVQELISAVDVTKHAAADVLVKAMVASPIDVVMNIQLASNATAATLDGQIRTVISQVIDAADGTLYQSEIVRQVMNITGVQTVGLPLLKCAKADGSYDIGVVIPTGTAWTLLSSDSNFSALSPQKNAFITSNVVVPNPTIPSGGPPNAYVGLLYEGQSYQRTLSIAQFLTSTVPSFYVIGADDQINASLPLPSTYAGRLLITTPSTSPDPSSLAYRLTYCVYGAASANDISVASCEYLSTGNVTIFYL